MEDSHPFPMNRRRFFQSSAVFMSGLAAACGDGPTQPRHPARLTTRPRNPTDTVSIGRSDIGLRDPFTGRDGFLYVPPGYAPATPTPLLVLLHGGSSAANSWWSQEFRDLVDPLGMVVLAPDSRAFLSWDVPGSGELQDDVAFLDDALRVVFDKVRVAPDRIGIGGFSDGATEALAIGRANGDLFSSIVALSPGLLHHSVRFGTPEVFLAHGTDDQVFPVEGTRDVMRPALEAEGLDVTWVEFDGGHAISTELGEQAFTWFING